MGATRKANDNLITIGFYGMAMQKGLIKEPQEAEPEQDMFDGSDAMVKTCEVVIKGIRPLLMSSPKEMYPKTEKKGMSKTRPKGEVDSESDNVDPRKEAEKRAYRDPKGQLCVEADAILACLYNAAKMVEQMDLKGKRVRGFNAVQNVKGSVVMEEDSVPLLDTKGRKVKDYNVHMKRVKNRFTGGAQIRFRPEIKEWSLRFRLTWNPKLYGLPEGALRKIVASAGRVGLLDWRPRYGTFKLVSFKVIE